MLGLGIGEILLIAVIALLVVGPDQLPAVARNVARFINEMKRSTEEFKKEFEDDAFARPLDQLKPSENSSSLSHSSKESTKQLEQDTNLDSTQETVGKSDETKENKNPDGKP